MTRNKPECLVLLYSDISKINAACVPVFPPKKRNWSLCEK